MSQVGLGRTSQDNEKEIIKEFRNQYKNSFSEHTYLLLNANESALLNKNGRIS